MAVVRNPLQCASCEGVVIIRTALGHRAKQTHRFPCPGCGAPIAYSVLLDQEQVDVRFEDPRNARWIEGEEAEAAEDDALAVLTFDSELLAPREGFFSPFQSTWRLFDDFAAFQTEEAVRNAALERLWPAALLLRSHFENENDALFDALVKEKFGRVPDAPRRDERFYVLHDVTFDCLRPFTYDYDDVVHAVGRRIGAARRRDSKLFASFISELVETGRAAALWRQLHGLHAEFMEVWESISPVLNIKYWKTVPDDLSEFAISSKNFDELKHFYVNCYESLCNLLIVAIALEAIVESATLTIPTRNGSMSVIPQFAALPNAQKRTHAERYEALRATFVPHMNAQLRNGVGHNSSFYDFTTDEVVCVADRGDSLVETYRENYTVFCRRVLDIFSMITRLETYLYMLLVVAQGEYRPTNQRLGRRGGATPLRGVESSARYRTL